MDETARLHGGAGRTILPMRTVGLSMIVKNGAADLRQCLESVRGVVQQIVIADTGSTDDSAQIARECGAMVIEVPWENHFANARNAALSPITTDWVLVLDADEELDRDAHAIIPKLLEAPGVGGYDTPIRNYIPNRFGRGFDRMALPNRNPHPRAQQAPAYIEHGNCRLFRRDPSIYFVGRVHELVEHQILRCGLKIPRAPFFIHHFGHLSDAARLSEKNSLYRRLGELKLEEDPNDFQAFSELGLQELENTRNYEKALQYFDKTLEMNPRYASAWIFKTMALLNLGRYEQALQSIQHADFRGPSALLAYHCLGDAAYNVGRFREARDAFRHALRIENDNPSVESRLGLTEVQLGHKQSGLAKLRHAVEQCPTVKDFYDRLIKGYVVAGQLESAAEIAELRIRLLPPDPMHYILAGTLYAQSRCWTKAVDILLAGALQFPEHERLRKALLEAETNRLLTAQQTSTHARSSSRL